MSMIDKILWALIIVQSLLLMFDLLRGARIMFGVLRLVALVIVVLA